MSLIRTVLDWESAYGIHPQTGFNYTLSKMTSEEYVRSSLFKAHGLGVKIGTERAFYVYGADLIQFLKEHPWEKTFAIQHHAHFDSAILSWRCGIRPAFIGCTLSMANALVPHEAKSLANLAKVFGLGEKGKELIHFAGKWNLTDEEQAVMGGYCRNDVELTSDLFDAMKGRMPLDELRLIDLTIRMFTEPVIEIDRSVLIPEFIREKRTKRALMKKCGVDKEVLASNDQFAGLLLSLGVDPPKKLSPSKVKDGRVDPDSVGEPPAGLLPTFKASKGLSKEEKEELKAAKNAFPWAYAFGKSDEEFKMLLDHPDPQVQAVVEARLGVKSTIKETRSKRFYKIGTRGAFPVYLTYYAARTGRWGGGDKVNTQNLGRIDPKDPTSGALRRSWLAPDGHVLVVRDLSQIEARTIAYWSGQDDLLDLFRAGGDPYNRQASAIFGYEVNRKLPQFWLEGMVGKASTLGNVYQMGWGKFQASLRIGFMGMPPLLFDQEAALKLGADIDVFCMSKSYKKNFAFLREEALSLKPLNVSEEAHLWHCAATKKIVDGFRASNSFIVALWKEMGNAFDEIIAGNRVEVGNRCGVYTCPEGLLLPNGMKIYYHKLRKTSGGEYKYLSDARRNVWERLYAGKGVENGNQALARIVIADQKLQIAERLKVRSKQDPGKIYKVVTSTHDEIVACVPEYWAEECLAMMGEEMSRSKSWYADMPLKSAGGFAKSYGECEK